MSRSTLIGALALVMALASVMLINGWAGRAEPLAVESPEPNEGSPDDTMRVPEAVGGRNAEQPLTPGAAPEEASSQDYATTLVDAVFTPRLTGMELPTPLPMVDVLLSHAALQGELASISEDEALGIRDLIDEQNAALEPLLKEARLQLHHWVGDKVRFGDCEPSNGQNIKPSPECAVSLHTDSEGNKNIVRVYSGEYAPLDVAYDDAWAQAQRARAETIKAVLQAAHN